MFLFAIRYVAIQGREIPCRVATRNACERNHTVLDFP